MSTTEIEQRVNAVVQEVLRVAPERITPQARFTEDLGADSLDRVSLIMALEEELKASISDEQAATLLTIGDVYRYAQNHSAAPGATEHHG